MEPGGEEALSTAGSTLVQGGDESLSWRSRVRGLWKGCKRSNSKLADLKGWFKRLCSLLSF